MLRFAVILISLSSVLPAFAADCFWTIQRNETEFKKSNVYSEGPKIQKEVCKANAAPLCMGYVYCPPARGAPRTAPNAMGVACKAIKVAMNWRCPDADTCYDDRDIEYNVLLENPGKPPAPVAAPAKPAPTDDPETEE